MKTNRWRQLSFLVISVLGSSAGLSSTGFAQTGDPRPVSRTGGFSGTELGNIYRQDIGQGFSSASLNQIALQNARAQQPYVGQMSTTRSGGGGGLGLGTRSNLSKPFSGFSPSPTTSPYLNLFRDDFDGGGDFNYNTLVRPQLQQQQFNQQLQRQNMETSRRLQSMAAQGDFNPQGAKDQYPTGHTTTFRYYGHWHPTVPYRPGKQAP